MKPIRVTGFYAGIFAACISMPFSLPTLALAQSEITVYAPFRGVATPIARAGSSVSVITREEIEQAGQLSVAELLRSVPGVSFITSGGFGSSTDVRIRGAARQHTLVLIDGVPVSDPSDIRNSFDFNAISTSVIEQIEVLRGPQSALYGSDAIGGVINIITKQSSAGLSGSASVEGGSFGTHREVIEASYGGEGFGIIASLSHFQTDGFSRRTSNEEADGSQQWSGFMRGSVQVSEDLQIDAQFQATDLESEYDSTSTGSVGVSNNVSLQGHVRAQYLSFDGRWTQTLTAFANSADRRRTTTSQTDYDALRVGLDYTSGVDLGALGTFLAGVNIEQQSAEQTPVGGPVRYSEEEVFWGAFAMHQFSLMPNFHLSAAVRIDDFDAAGTFITGRGTAVYEIFETETRIHSSIGTGANAPTLYQRFGASTPSPNLLPEESIGFDLGVSQVLFDGRLTVDVTGFYNIIDNMIDYDFGTSSYINIDEAETYGVEVSADARLIPGQLDASAHYTYLIAKDSNGFALRRRPEHEAQLILTYTGIDRLRLTGSVNWVGGDRFNSVGTTGPTGPLDPYVRVDVNASYQAHENLEIFGRVENLFDADYEEISGYNTPGLSAYAGVRATF